MDPPRPQHHAAGRKTTGNYANSTLAKMEALNAGYDEAIMLNGAGLVSECSGENIFVAKGDVILTPPTSSGHSLVSPNTP